MGRLGALDVGLRILNRSLANQDNIKMRFLLLLLWLLLLQALRD